MADTDPINWLLLVELLVVVIVASAFLFYWNRLVASIFAFFVRLVTWRYYNAYISIGSLQISPLAGRISFRDIEYHSSNLSFRALHGHLTFRYWWWRVRQEGDSQSNNTKRGAIGCPRRVRKGRADMDQPSCHVGYRAMRRVSRGSCTIGLQRTTRS